MRTIEVFHLKGPDRQLICRMHFISDKDFKSMIVRLTTGAPFNTLRRERVEACHVRVDYGNGLISDYHTDKVTKRIINICTEYMLIYGHAKKLAQKKGWLYAWYFSDQDWKHKAALKAMGKAAKLLTKDTILHVRRGLTA